MMGIENQPSQLQRNEELTIPVASDDNVETEKECGLESTLRDDLRLTNCIPESRSPIETSSDQLSGASDSRESMDEAGDVPHGQGDALNIPKENPSLPVNKESSSGEPIIVPIVLKMAEFDHKELRRVILNRYSITRGVDLHEDI
ncbi:hypothetical protein IFM89_024844 [Coptis chinensis]|uniref:Uncharacterized protein n=1 Tax=Coptis chinensis TaxID=261450 RepID=A0A835LRE2_9MAGN|nr:hypothetical protein IFM89_024844 [Coptis chinensis]